MTDKKYLDEWCQYIHEWAKGKGWWETERNTGEILALFHSEISEALEEWRVGQMDTTFLDDGKPVGFYSELADVVIRIMDTFGQAGKSLEEEIRVKMLYNQTRPYRHGGKLA